MRQGSLKELYAYCEKNGRADIGGEVRATLARRSSVGLVHQSLDAARAALPAPGSLCFVA